MRLTGLHLLLTYRCNYQCNHCFVWGGPGQTGTMTSLQIEDILGQATDQQTIEWIYFEGGEPFQYYPVLRRGVERARRLGFRVGVVTNAFWATDPEDAREWLRPLAGLVDDLSMSRDMYHGNDARPVKNAERAAGELGIPVDVITVAQPEVAGASRKGVLPSGEAQVMFRGRAAETLARRAPHRSWDELVTCPYENLREPSRLHVDPFGHLHVCQGISVGNLFERPLSEIMAAYDPGAHPIVGPLLSGGPVELARRYGRSHADDYADECQFCFETRRGLRSRFPEDLTPDQTYGDPTRS